MHIYYLSPSLISSIFVCVFRLFVCVSFTSKSILGLIWNFKKSLQYSINFRLDIMWDSIQNQVDISFNEENSKPLEQVLDCNGVISTGRPSQSRPNLFYMLNCNGVPSTKNIHWKRHKGHTFSSTCRAICIPYCLVCLLYSITWCLG